MYRMTRAQSPSLSEKRSGVPSSAESKIRAAVLAEVVISSKRAVPTSLRVSQFARSRVSYLEDWVLQLLAASRQERSAPPKLGRNLKLPEMDVLRYLVLWGSLRYTVHLSSRLLPWGQFHFRSTDCFRQS